MKKRLLIATGVALAIVAAACSDDSSSDTTIPAVLPEFGGAEDFVEGIDNPYWPAVPGSRWVYEGVDEGEVEVIEVTVLDDTRDIGGITATIIRDTVEIDGELAEDTYDWYGQDTSGNVWYLGEDSTEYENGEAVSTAGSWETGVDGAVPGIIMYADLESQVGEAYFQEFYEGEAVDKAVIEETGATVTVAAGTFEDVVVIREWNPLEPGKFENKYLAPGVGVVLEEVVEGGEGRVELISFEPGG